MTEWCTPSATPAISATAALPEEGSTIRATKVHHWDVVVDARRAQAGLRAETERVVRLLLTVNNPGAPALGQWSVAEVAMHLSQVSIVVSGMAARDLSAVHEVLPELKGVAGESVINDLWELGQVTQMGVREDGERDLGVLADRIAGRAGDYLAARSRRPEQDLRAWIVKGTEVPVVTLTCHLLNEMIVHGWDIARAEGREWPVKPAHAVLVIDGLLIPIFQVLGPRAVVDQEQAAGLHATYEIRVKGGGRHVFRFDDGELLVEAPSSRPVDCYLEVDPAAFLMIAWGRQDQGPAIVSRQIVSSGPKAWLGPRFRALMRNP